MSEGMRGVFTKSIEKEDFDNLRPYYHKIADCIAQSEDVKRLMEQQHPMRKWEYALALAASDWFIGKNHIDRQLVSIDVGGAGSPFAGIVEMTIPAFCEVVDPRVGQTLNEYKNQPDRSINPDIVYCISVIEHVPSQYLEQFVYDLVAVLNPGGMLFLTTDFINIAKPVDTHHFYWMRERIYDYFSLHKLVEKFEKLGMKQFGEVGPTYGGAYVYDYTFHSLCMVKEK